MNTQLFNNYKDGYKNLYDGMIINPSALSEVSKLSFAIKENQDRYNIVQKATGVDWKIIGIIHQMECGGSFKLHLHNGDPLTARTVQVPKGRPLTGNPPFKWEDSAIDAIQEMGFKSSDDWSIEGILFHLEIYNGVGYRKHGINSPYLWAATNQYTKGKFTTDGHFDPEAVSKQIGAAPILKHLM